MKKIVLIEDDQVLSDALAISLEDAGFQVFKAYDGVIGQKLVKSKKPDLVLLDLLMPKKDGFMVLQELRTSSLTNHIPVIILSLINDELSKKRCIDLGAVDYLVKSDYSIDKVVSKINKFF